MSNKKTESYAYIKHLFSHYELTEINWIDVHYWGFVCCFFIIFVLVIHSFVFIFSITAYKISHVSNRVINNHSKYLLVR